VLAPANGIVKALRDGEEDALKTDGNFDAVQGRECGNGIVIEHKMGIVTQLCHLKKGSITVKVGDIVKRGDAIAQMGASGRTQFPHLEMNLRIDDDPIDPFSGNLADGKCGDLSKTLWDEATLKALEPKAGEVIDMILTDRILANKDIDLRQDAWPQMTAQSAALVLAVRSINLQAGDIQEIELKNQAGEVLAKNRFDALPRNQAVYVANAGLRRKDAPWPQGTYTGVFRVLREGKTYLEQSADFEIR
jgi:Peptidase family M23